MYICFSIVFSICLLRIECYCSEILAMNHSALSHALGYNRSIYLEMMYTINLYQTNNQIQIGKMMSKIQHNFNHNQRIR